MRYSDKYNEIPIDSLKALDACFEDVTESDKSPRSKALSYNSVWNRRKAHRQPHFD